MATVATKRMTADEFYDFANRPENRWRRLELERGRVIDLDEVPEPLIPREAVCANAARILANVPRQAVTIDITEVNESCTTVMRRVHDRLQQGASLIWVIDPAERMVVVYRPGHSLQIVEATGELTGDYVLPDFRCKVADFFALPGQ